MKPDKVLQNEYINISFKHNLVSLTVALIKMISPPSTPFPWGGDGSYQLNHAAQFPRGRQPRLDGVGLILKDICFNQP